MPHVIIVTKSKKNGLILENQLSTMLGNYIHFENISLEVGFKTPIQCDLALVATQELATQIAKYLKPKTEILVIRRTLFTKEWKKILSIPPGTKALLVNSSQEVAIQTVALLYELGANHLELIPYYSGCALEFPLTMAITPNEPEIVPDFVKTTINIGNRVIDTSTIFELLKKLKLLNNETKEVIFKGMENTIPLNPGLLEMFIAINETNECLELVLNIIDQSVIYFDSNHMIQIYNEKAQRMFNLKPHILKSLNSLFQDESSIKLFSEPRIKDEIFIFNGLHFLVSKYPLSSNDKKIGDVLTLKECTKIEDQTMKFHQSLANRGHVAKYTFDNILGESTILSKTIVFAKKNAMNGNDILIEGESGTGKELFAQAIHNASKRNTGPFVAFNCATLSGSLLESELFGYEQGAFTGAQKGGKPGMFELANKGTIFLDEIAEISPETQAKLLRVLQEREIVRVGGTKIIPIDIRVISATNHDLYKLVKEKKFRADLYFRLNVMSIKLPPLRERTGDILYLSNYFLHKNNCQNKLPDSLVKIFLSYSWPGNIRELKNCIDYMVNMSDDFSIDSLPNHMLNKNKFLEKENSPIPQEIKEIGEPTETFAILQILQESHQQHKHIGRKLLSALLADKDIFLSEQEVRATLKKLSDLGFIHISQGRAGTKITSNGLNLLNQH